MGRGIRGGVAADVAKAVRWLAERDLSGLASLLRALRDKDAVVIAASLADGASALTETPLELEEFCAPLLLVPFLAWASVLTRGKFRSAVCRSFALFCQSTRD